MFNLTTLDKFVTLQRGFDLPAQNRIMGVIPIIASNGLTGFHNVSKVLAPGVVLGRSGSVGNPQLIKDDFWPLNTTLFVKDFHGNNPTFVYYALKTIDFKSFDAGGTVPTLNRNHLTQIAIPEVHPKMQTTIAGILSNLDKKIETNKQLSKTLEDIAQTIFKSWFIDFDPVKAKMAGQKPVGMDAATAALFPDFMEDSELGLIPKGWEVRPLGEIVDLTWGDAKTTKASYVSMGYLAYSAKGQDGVLPTYKYDQVGIVLSAIGAGCGKTWLATGKWSCIKNTIRLLEKAEYPDAIPYVYLVTANPDFWPKRGSAQPFIGQEDSRGVRIIVPNRNLLDVFAQVVTPMYEQVSQLKLENVSLEKIRNQILGPLISGELQIPEAMLAS